MEQALARSAAASRGEPADQRSGALAVEQARRPQQRPAQAALRLTRRGERAIVENP